MDHSHYKVLNAGIPGHEDNDMLLFNLDIEGISVSGGSACASGSSIGSHVLEALGVDQNTGALRLSFSRFNTEDEVDRMLSVLKSIMKNKP
jgi:cysteine desulfurase